MYCSRCGSGQPDDHRFCAACGAQLPVESGNERTPKVTRLYLGVQTSEHDAPGAVLRVSGYLEDHEFSAPEGTVTVPGDHVRFSVWVVDRPVAAISLTASDADELAHFLEDPEPAMWPRSDATSGAAG
jgi:hypothetical protein